MSVASRGSRRRARAVVMIAAAASVTVAVVITLTPMLTGPAAVRPGEAVYVAATGSDSAPCSASAPCASFDRAYRVAAPGATVVVGAGSYGPQTITTDSAKAAGPDVTFRTAPGALAVVAGIVVRQASHITFLGDSIATPQNLAGAASGITLMPTPAVVNSGASASVTQCSDHITFRGVDAQQVAVNNSNDVSFSDAAVGGHNNTGFDSVVTPAYYTSNQAVCADANPTGIVFSHIVFHDVSRELAPEAHPDCLQISGTAGILIERSVFMHCATSNILARPSRNIWPGAAVTGVVIRNNFLGPLTEGGNQMLLGAASDTCGTVEVQYNTVDADTLGSFTCGSYASLRIVGNWQRSAQRYTCEQTLAKATQYESNAIGYTDRKNAIASCGARSRLTGDPQFVDEPVFDYRLRRRSPLIGAAGTAPRPTSDIDGKRRPLTGPADVGASQWESALSVPGRAIGGVAIGMSQHEVEQIYGRSPRPSRAVAGATQVEYPLHGHLLIVTYVADRVAGIGTTSAYYRDDRDFGVGSALPTGERGTWLECRRAYVRRRGSTVEIVTPAGGRHGRTVAALGWAERRVTLCRS